MPAHLADGVTLLYANIGNDTDIRDDLPWGGSRPEASRAASDQYQSTLAATIESHNGKIFHSVKDGIAAAFLSATSAIAAGVAVQRSLSVEPTSQTTPSNLRTVVYVAPTKAFESDPIDHYFILLRKLLSVCQDGHILISSAAGEQFEDQLPDGTSVVNLGQHKFRNPDYVGNFFQISITRQPGRFPNNLPSQLTPFIGREWEIGEVMSLLESPQVSLTTIYGLGGAGKTRLAIEVAQSCQARFLHGSWFLSLASLASADLIYDSICLALELSYSSGVDRKTQLLDYIRDKNLLLILDNLEHLLPDIRPFLEKILASAPGVKILATSRQRLDMLGEWVYRLTGLDYPEDEEDNSEAYDAVALFFQQLRQRGYPLTEEERSHAVRVCQLVEGMPLALVMAASWARALTLAEMVQEIEHGLTFLESRTRMLPKKHRSMQAVFDQSWQMLSEGEKAVLCRLAVFEGSFEREAAGGVAGADLFSIAALVDKGLLERDADGRFKLHALLRQYLYQQLSQAGEESGIKDAHLRYFRQFAERAEPELGSHDQTLWFNKLDLEYNNILNAIKWGIAKSSGPVDLVRSEDGLRLVQALWYYWHVRWDWKEGREWYAKCLELPLAKMTAIVQVRAYAYAAVFESVAGDWERAFQWAEKALSLAQSLETEEGLALALLRKGGVLRMKDPKLGRVLIQRSLETYRRLKDSFYTAAALFYLGQESNGSDQEQVYLSECLEVSQAAGNKRYAAFALLNLGGVACHQGDLVEAKALHRKSYALFKEMRDIGGLFVASRILGMDYLHMGDMNNAESLFQECWSLAESSGDQNLIAETYEHFGHLAGARGKLDQAGENYDKSLQIYREIGKDENTVGSLHGLGLMVLAQDDPGRALSLVREALSLHWRFRSKLVFECVQLIDSLAYSLAALEQPAKAVKLFSSVEMLLQSTGYRLLPQQEKNHNQWLADARKNLDKSKYAVAWRYGRQMTLEQAVDYALTADQVLEVANQNQSKTGDPAGLTAREVEVLHLVAQGLTDIQVAETLIISPRTVNAHLTSIYRKLDVNSRAAATRFAVEHGLA